MNDFSERFGNTLNKRTKRKLFVARSAYLTTMPVPVKQQKRKGCFKLDAGEVLEYTKRFDVGVHSLISLVNPIEGSTEYFVRDDHVIYDYKGLPDVVSFAEKVPYFSISDTGVPDSALSACAAMVMAYYNVPARNPNEPMLKNPDAAEMEIFTPFYFLNYTKARGYNYNLPSTLVKVFADDYGITCAFSKHTSFQKIKKHVATGNPVIVSCKLTSWGTSVLIVGYDDEKSSWIVHDPYGQYKSPKNGSYLVNEFGGYPFGKNQAYSYGTLSRLSYSGDKHSWAYLIG